MNLKVITFRNLMRRKGKAAFVIAGLVIGVSTVVGIISFVEAMTNDINHKLEKYGANILIVPRTENLTLTYGGLSLGGVSFEMQEIHEAELTQIGSIKNARNIAALGPLVLGVINVRDRRVPPRERRVVERAVSEAIRSNPSVSRLAFDLTETVDAHHQDRHLEVQPGKVRHHGHQKLANPDATGHERWRADSYDFDRGPSCGEQEWSSVSRARGEPRREDAEGSVVEAAGDEDRHRIDDQTDCW